MNRFIARKINLAHVQQSDVLLFASLLLFVFAISGCQSVGTNQPPKRKASDDNSQTSQYQQMDKVTSNLNILELQQLMATDKLTAQQLTKFYLKQIAIKNPELNAVITVNPNAISIARSLDAQRAAGDVRGPLHGIPILIKDNIETQQMATTAGSLALADNFTKRDATLVKKLKAAGAIILGKTNLSEWANFRSNRSSSGWSAVGGQTRNPHDMTRTACGSSSGSGAVVAANMSVAAIGTETNGSMTCPASANGIVGLKPTVGSVSRMGIVPISYTQDTAGPMTKNVTDAAIIMNAMTGVDAQDKATERLKDTPLSISIPNTTFSLAGKRIGILYSSALAHEGVNRVFEQVKQQFQNQGAILVEGLSTHPYNGFYQDSYEVLLYEFKAGLNQYFSKLPNKNNQLTLEKIIQFNQRNKETEMQYFLQEKFDNAQMKGPLTESQYIEALSRIKTATREQGIDKLIKDNNIDILMTATLTPAWKIDLLNGDNYKGYFSTYPAIAGYPHLTLPMGDVHGMPVGLSFTAEAMSEQKLLNYAYVYEQIKKEKVRTSLK
ncbi:amidase [Shewanella intestini]|uniref:Amidase n=1 Tax=Shewanella intestini TaxID=2017544 RepID=A0ABS5I4P6_9GAMM|nr:MULTISPECIES: amidase [Shewanella]MBR9728994.1 amidase [Shewanella intestini]MRG36940.1 amidase [Shewanella sp. XMDDZSB0408]